MEREGQQWVLDALLQSAGMDVLFTDVLGGYLENGHKYCDYERTMKRVRSMPMLGPSWAITGKQLEEQAIEAEQKGHLITARGFYHRASLYYSRAMWSVMRENDPNEDLYCQKSLKCYQKVIDYNDYPIEKVEIPVPDGRTIPALLHLHKKIDKPVPCIFFVTGMDMAKEDFPNPLMNYAIQRGMACISIDGPGQGESLVRGYKVTLENYDEAGKATIDYLATRKEIDINKIGLMGISMGSYWAPHIASYDNRVKACAGTIANFMQKYTMFKLAPPNFRKKYMYMAGIYDDAEFDKMASRMTLEEVVDKIKCQMLLVAGQYDQLCPSADTDKFFELLDCPKELWMFENEFHTIGNRRSDWLPRVFDWLQDAVEDRLPKDLNKKIFYEQLK